jgi:hypothetical protein
MVEDLLELVGGALVLPGGRIRQAADVDGIEVAEEAVECDGGRGPLVVHVCL